MLLAFVLAQASAHTGAHATPDLRQLSVFATIERIPSFSVDDRVRIGTFRDDPSGPQTIYWFVREREHDDQKAPDFYVTTTRDCPAALKSVQQLETLQLPKPDVPNYRKDYNITIVDGTEYHLKGIARHSDGQSGDYSIESNEGSPLARWANRLFKDLNKCWRPIAKPW